MKAGGASRKAGLEVSAAGAKDFLILPVALSIAILKRSAPLSDSIEHGL